MSTQSNWGPAITVELKIDPIRPEMKEFNIVAPAVEKIAPRIPFVVENLGPHEIEVTLTPTISPVVSTLLRDVGAAGYFVSTGTAKVFLHGGATSAKVRITVGSPWNP
jgi:hypothetical protein